ncbi:DUF4402 domain-containing protein [Geomonas sp. Red69]|uniref:DUF4402 domain-containing protein n=1 Tax=Geomonas diazotrophica TaxID=2843197 RepID=A0ABX8JIK4_9BACT|nr:MULTISPECIES: DUF4402 domain-containing protein [Geomonas]MBU5635371.1 DUF4402 domain-containing protein [Geomonas diazotrophica]QWV97573.1 DUF4402 domain-containing protein [Geomonas nitrogeniifigens]QXE86714.1 DUF4402 domain-containing protein [Geomonas nitrogeniifigens]
MTMRAYGFLAKPSVAFLTLWYMTETTAFAAPTIVTRNQDFDFGRVAGGAGRSGTVTITSAGSRTYSGNVLPLGTTFSAARFTITGNAGETYTMTLPAEVIINAGVDQMTVTAITSSIPLTGVIPAGGSVSFSVGGTLNVGAVQRNAQYSGSMNVSVK